MLSPQPHQDSTRLPTHAHCPHPAPTCPHAHTHARTPSQVAADADQSQADYLSDDDDSPKVTDPALKNPASAYQQALAAIRDDTLPQFDNGTLHAALRHVVASPDEAAPDALDYLCAAGVPRYPLPGEESLAVLAALRYTHPRYKDLLVTLVSYGFEFNATSNATGQSAADIVNARAPGFFSLVQREAWVRNSAL